MEIMEIRRRLSALGNYDTAIAGAIGEVYAEEVLGMEKAPRGATGYDGTLAGRRIQVKSKEHNNRPRSRSYIAIRTGKETMADDLLVVVLAGDKCEHIGPVPIA